MSKESLTEKERVIENINKRIGLRIMKRRSMMVPKMSQEQLGQLAGEVSHAQIGRYERGDQHIPGARLVLIAEALGTTVSYFVGIEEFIEEKGSLTLEEKETLSNLMEYFREIGLPEVRDALLDHIQRISRISFTRKEPLETEYRAEGA